MCYNLFLLATSFISCLLFVQALKRELESQKKAEVFLAMDERKRPYNSMFEAKAPTEEEMEAWRMKRRREEDPMSNFT
jgi:pre-mRNA-processing factor SLU7